MGFSFNTEAMLEQALTKFEYQFPDKVKTERTDLEQQYKTFLKDPKELAQRSRVTALSKFAEERSMSLQDMIMRLVARDEDELVAMQLDYYKRVAHAVRCDWSDYETINRDILANLGFQHCVNPQY